MQRQQTNTPDASYDGVEGILEALLYLTGEAEKLGLYELARRIRAVAYEADDQGRPTYQ
jgi:hypothetical protein